MGMRECQSAGTVRVRLGDAYEPMLDKNPDHRILNARAIVNR